MGIKIELQQVVPKDDGSLTVYVNFIDNITNKRLKQICVESENEAGIKDAVRPYFQRIIQEQADKNILLTSVQNVLTEIEQEG